MTNLVGMHDEEGAHVAPGWCLVTVEAFHPGRDFHHLVKPIVRLNNGYHPNGTIPQAQDYPRFAQACGEYVRTSKGCRHWIIGNEPNLAHERPQGHPISAQSYVACFNLCRDAIKRVQPDAVVIPAPVGPWNTETGDWLVYQQILWAAECDGLAIHTYGSLDKAYMQPPYDGRKYGFWAYQDFMAVIPADKRHLPVFLTETNENVPWRTGWFTQAIEEVVRWNASGKQPIHCVLPYCYIHRDQFGLDGKGDVLDEIRTVYAREYTAPQPSISSSWGKRSRTEQVVIHHSATPPTVTAQAIRDYHLSRGYKGIAYHALVYRDGTVEQVNPWDALSWHAGCGFDSPQNANAYSIGVCLVGDFTHEPPPAAQMEGTRRLVGKLVGMFGPLKVIGHREAYRVSTECPGNAFTTEMVHRLLPPAGDLPEHETSTDPVVLSDKLRWYLEEEQRMREQGNTTRADAIHLSLIILSYRLTQLLKES
jgi:hypothetical protein